MPKFLFSAAAMHADVQLPFPGGIYCAEDEETERSGTMRYCTPDLGDVDDMIFRDDWQISQR